MLGRWWIQRPTPSTIGVPLAIGREPVQELLHLAGSKILQRQDNFSRIELTHRFEIIGEAVAVTSYRWAFTNPYYDVDLGLAWGPRARTYKEKLKFRQGARWLMWSSHEPMDESTLSDIKLHIGNLHLIPAEGRPELSKAIHWIDKGDLVRVRGFLVKIHGPSGELIATSSTARDDTGDGACEIVWVEELQIDTRIYR